MTYLYPQHFGCHSRTFRLMIVLDRNAEEWHDL